MTERQDIVGALLEHAGLTYASEATITLKDKPAPLYRLPVLDATWQERVDALGRAHYERYDESTATALGEGAQLLVDEYSGDLREVRSRADGDSGRIRELLTGFPRLGPVGADIFAREAQAVWPELRPALDGKALDGARRRPA